MSYFIDEDTTPRPLRVVNPEEWAERSPYIPRRKSSNKEGPVQAASMADISKPSRVHQHENISQDRYFQKARFPIDGYDSLSGRTLHQIPLKSGPYAAIPQSSSRRFLNRMFSNLPFPSNPSRRQSTDPKTLIGKFGRTHQHTGSNTSSRASSMLSIGTTISSSQDNTVRRRRQLASNTAHSVMSDSPNPLRAPPPSLLGPIQDMSGAAEATEATPSTTGSSLVLLEIPILAFSEFHYLTFAGKNHSKNNSPCNVWVIVEILCSLTQGADKESFTQNHLANKSFNNPGFLKSVALALSPLQNCQITAVLGQCKAATLSPVETITAIVHVTLDKSLFPSTRSSPKKENGRPEGNTSGRRPTSDLLNDELLKQLLGKFKRTSQAKEEEFEEQILQAKVTYNHSLFPAGQQITHEDTLTVTRATIYNARHDALRKHKQKGCHDSLQLSGIKQLSAEESETVANSIIRILCGELRFDDNATDVASQPAINAGQAVTLLNDFLAAAASLPPDTNRTLEMLKFRYSMLINVNEEQVAAQSKVSPKRYNPFDRRNDVRKNFEPDFPRDATYKTELHNDRRDAFEMDREETNLGMILSDVTNRQNYGDHNLLPNGTLLLGHDGKIDLTKDNAIPAPLFSPKRCPNLVHSSVTELLSINSSTKTPKKADYHGGCQHLQNSIGSASFYAAEVEEMARQAFGGPTTTCHHRGEFLHQSIEKDEEPDGRNDTTEEDGNEKARKIWERMRISSEGSNASARSTEARFSDESADDEERARECKVVGAPWLA